MMTELTSIPALPSSWIALSWQQLCDVWDAKIRYGNSDVARAAALMALCCLSVDGKAPDDPLTAEQVYLLRGNDGRMWTATARQLAHVARIALPWFDYPYGDPGEDAVKDDKGKVVKERREGVKGYVNPKWRDAMNPPVDELPVTIPPASQGGKSETLVFALPLLACNNLTWEQYRSLQSLAPQLFQEGFGDDQRLQLQAQFVAHCLVPEHHAEPSADRFCPKHLFKYDAARAEQSIGFWADRLTERPAIFHICFQIYHTAVLYYEQVYPMLFNGGGKEDPLRDALTGEVATLNAVMKYARYRSQREVYESYLPYILDILNTMTKEAKEIERINSRIRRGKTLPK